MNELPTLPERLPEDPEERLAVIGAIVRARVVAALPGSLLDGATRVLDAWGRATAEQRDECLRTIVQATPAVVIEVDARLCELFALPAAAQRETPLEIVRRAAMTPTDALQRAAVPGIVRDPFDVAHAPHDVYGLAPRTLAELGDPELGPMQLAWGLAKHHALRA
ncbi:MAG: hypothetical protein ACOYN3_07085 [Acidimicrobiia bacterium]